MYRDWLNAPKGHRMESKLSVQGISKSFRLRRGGNVDILKVLQSISFDIKQGEVVSLVGESGCGKTTLLRMSRGWSPPITAASWSTAPP